MCRVFLLYREKVLLFEVRLIFCWTPKHAALWLPNTSSICVGSTCVTWATWILVGTGWRTGRGIWWENILYQLPLTRIRIGCTQKLCKNPLWISVFSPFRTHVAPTQKCVCLRSEKNRIDLNSWPPLIDLLNRPSLYWLSHFYWYDVHFWWSSSYAFYIYFIYVFFFISLPYKSHSIMMLSTVTHIPDLIGRENHSPASQCIKTKKIQCTQIVKKNKNNT